MGGERVGEPVSAPSEHGLITPLVVADVVLATAATFHRAGRSKPEVATASGGASLGERACDYAAAVVFGTANIVAAVGNFVKRHL